MVEIPSPPSSNANYLPPLPTQTSPCAAVVDLAVPGLRSPGMPLPTRNPSSAGDELGSPVYYDYGGSDFHVQNEYEYLWNEWDHDENVWDEPYDDGGDAFLHYDPDADVRPLAGFRSGTLKSPSLTSPPSPFGQRLAAIPEDNGPVVGSSRVRDRSGPPVEAVTKGKQGRPRKVATDESDAEPATAPGKDISQEELNAKLKEAVLKDEVLHLRILRYEVWFGCHVWSTYPWSDHNHHGFAKPIHFDVFMQLASDAGVTEKTKLKGKVRTFLDQKVCIRDSHISLKHRY